MSVRVRSRLHTLSTARQGQLRCHSRESASAERMTQDKLNAGLQQQLQAVFSKLAVMIAATLVAAIAAAGIVAGLWLDLSLSPALMAVFAAGVLTVAVGVFLSLRAARASATTVIEPIVWLAQEVGSWDIKDPDFQALGSGRLPAHITGEGYVLSQAIHNNARRLSEFVERERNFTRDASHELRTPLTVIKMASQVLISDSVLDPYATRNVERIQSSARDMEALIEAFLLIAREAENALPADDIAVNSVVREELEAAQATLGDREIDLQFVESGQFRLHAPSKVVAVLIGNLLRNAISFTDKGHVKITVDDGEVVIEDTGIGMSADDLKQIFQPFFRAQHGRRGGHGVGLAVVKRLSDRYRWPIEYESTVGKGTRVRVRFPDRIVVNNAATVTSLDLPRLRKPPRAA